MILTEDPGNRMKESTEDLAGLGACRSESRRAAERRSRAAGTESVGARPGRHRQGTLSWRPQGAGHEEPTRGLSFPFCFVDPNPSGIQFTGGGFLPAALQAPHRTDARGALTASPHVRSVRTRPSTPTSMHTQRRITAHGGSGLLKPKPQSRVLCLKRRAEDAAEGQREACSPPAVSRTLPLQPRATPRTEASCGRSRCESSMRPVVTSGGAECTSALEKQTHMKVALDSKEVRVAPEILFNESLTG